MFEGVSVCPVLGNPLQVFNIKRGLFLKDRCWRRSNSSANGLNLDEFYTKNGHSGESYIVYILPQ